MKLRKLHIEDYKMFKDFDISFVDENDEALPIVILAGVNGSGKTTLLESLFIPSINNQLRFISSTDSLITMEMKNEKSFFAEAYSVEDSDPEYSSHLIVTNVQEIEESISDFNVYKKNIIYFPSGIDDTKSVADEFVKTFYFYLKDKDYRSSEITEHFHNYMKDIFDGLNIGFTYSHLDKDDNVWFSTGENEEYYYTAKKNDNEDKNIFTIDELSTGEKTLLSKIMYLYFKDYKDKVILIDEPELSLHPSWQNKVLKIYENFAKQNNCQIIIATHSPHIIGSAKNEYLRILRKKEDGSIEVINDLKAHGRDINSILFDVMGEVAYRPREFKDKIDKLYEDIDNRKFEEAKEKLAELKKDYGEKDSVVQEAEILIDVLSSEE